MHQSPNPGSRMMPATIIIAEIQKISDTHLPVIGLDCASLIFVAEESFVDRAALKTLKFISLPLVAWSCLILGGCKEGSSVPQTVSPQPPAQRSVEALADEYLAAVLERKPEMGTSYSIPGARHDALYDNSLEALAAWQAREDAWLQELGSIGAPEDIGSRDWVTHGILREALAGSIAKRVCRSELWQASSATAWHTSKPSVFEIQPRRYP